MNSTHTFLGLDMQTVISMVVGIVIGGLITWLASWYYAKQSTKDMENLIAEAARQLSDKIPADAAKKVTEHALLNAVLEVGPIAFKLLNKITEVQAQSKGKESKSSAAAPP